MQWMVPWEDETGQWHKAGFGPSVLGYISCTYPCPVYRDPELSTVLTGSKPRTSPCSL